MEKSMCKGVLTFKGDKLALTFEKIVKSRGSSKEENKMAGITFCAGIDKESSN